MFGIGPMELMILGIIVVGVIIVAVAVVVAKGSGKK